MKCPGSPGSKRTGRYAAFAGRIRPAGHAFGGVDYRRRASETGDCPPGAQRFAKISVDQVLKALPSKMGFPAMTLELYDTETNAENVYDIRQRPNVNHSY